MIVTFNAVPRLSPVSVTFILFPTYTTIEITNKMLFLKFVEHVSFSNDSLAEIVLNYKMTTRCQSFLTLIAMN